MKNTGGIGLVQVRMSSVVGRWDVDVNRTLMNIFSREKNNMINK